MSMNTITAQEIRDTGTVCGLYKGFNVFVSKVRGGYSSSVLLLLDDGDAAHSIGRASGCTLSEVKEEARALINDYPFTAKQLLKMNKNKCLCNLDSRMIFVRNPQTGEIEEEKMMVFL